MPAALAIGLSLVTAALAAAGAHAPQIVHRHGGNEGALVALPDGTLRLFVAHRDGHVSSISSQDGGETWDEPRREFELPGEAAYASVAFVDHDGELHVFYLQWRGQGRIAVDRFLDIGHVQTTGGRQHWADPKIIWQGYCGSIRAAVQMKTGRIVLPFAAWQTDRPAGPPTGSNVVTNVYSDDGGTTWHTSDAALESPCFDGYNGSNYGACEPTLITLQDNRLWMLMRTQTGVLYESFSTDGVTWTDAQPTHFYSSNSPPALLRLSDGRLVLFWNNSLMPNRVDGQGVYGGRDALHAAISADEGKTWRGFREVYRDPTRNESPPRSGDRGTAYPTAVQAAEGHIVLATGQGAGRRAIVRFHPDWLEERDHQSRLAEGLEDWHVFKGIGPARGWWQDRTQGPQLALHPKGQHPNESKGRVLHLRRPDDHSPDGAAWNFPSGRRGTLELSIKLNDGFRGARLALTDRLFDPSDQRVADEAMFCLDIAADGALQAGQRLPSDEWLPLSLEWDVDARKCVVQLDGQVVGTLSLNKPTANGVSYLHLQSTAEEVDHAGWMVASVEVVIDDRRGREATWRPSEVVDRLELRSELTELPDLPMGPFARAENGDIVAVDGNDFLRSTDEGETWNRTPLFKAASGFQVSRERALLVTRKGTIIVACMNLAERHWTWDPELGDAPGAKLPTYVLRSSDDGQSWDKPRKMHDDWSGAVRDMIETRDGRIVFTAMKMRHDPGRHTVLTYGSSDDGQTWEPSNVIDLGGAGDHGGVTEGTIEQHLDGHLLLYFRTNWMKQWWAESRDDGRSWHVIGPTCLDSSSAPAMLKRISDGRLVVVWNRPFPEGKQSYPMTGGDRKWSATPVSNFRSELSMAVSSDDGQSWSEPLVIARVPQGWLAYPYVFEPQPGTLWITTMQGGLRARLDMKEVDFAVAVTP